MPVIYQPGRIDLPCLLWRVCSLWSVFRPSNQSTSKRFGKRVRINHGQCNLITQIANHAAAVSRFYGCGSLHYAFPRPAGPNRTCELVRSQGGFPKNPPPDLQLPSRKITFCFTYGSLFYAAAKTLEEVLPAAEEAKQAVVIFILGGGHEEFGSTLSRSIGTLHPHHPK